MTHYVIFDWEGNLRGYTDDKEVLDIFTEQRAPHTYDIRSVKKGNKKVIRRLKDAFVDMDVIHGVYVFQDEYEYIYDKVEEILGSLTAAFDSLRIFMDVLKLSDGDKETLTLFDTAGEWVNSSVYLSISTGEAELVGEYIDVTQLTLDVLHKEALEVVE